MSFLRLTSEIVMKKAMKLTPPKQLLPAAAVFAGAILIFCGNTQAGEGDKLIRLSHELEDISGDLRYEFQRHYSHTTAYRHLLGYAARIESEADHIHSLAHDCRTTSVHILTDLKELDQVSSQLHNIVDQADRGRYGQIYGDTRHVHDRLGYLTRVIHAMEVEVMMIRRAAPRVIPQVLPQTGLLSNVPCDAPNPYAQPHSQVRPSIGLFGQSQHHAQSSRHQQELLRRQQQLQAQQQQQLQEQQQRLQFENMKKIGKWLGQGGRNTTYTPPQQVAPQNGMNGFQFGGRTFWFRR